MKREEKQFSFLCVWFYSSSSPDGADICMQRYKLGFHLVLHFLPSCMSSDIRGTARVTWTIVLFMNFESTLFESIQISIMCRTANQINLNVRKGYQFNLKMAATLECDSFDGLSCWARPVTRTYDDEYSKQQSLWLVHACTSGGLRSYKL